MCEPHHSIIQFRNTDEDGYSSLNRLNMQLGQIMRYSKTLGGFIHFSQIGKGHSESFEQVHAHKAEANLPGWLAFEGQWWDRTVHLDRGSSTLQTGDPDDERAIEMANRYSKEIAFANVPVIENFLRASINASDRPYMYLDKFKDAMLTEHGRPQFTREIDRMLQLAKVTDVQAEGAIDHLRCLCSRTLDAAEGERKRKIISSCMAAACQVLHERNLLADAWADDASLWRPAQA